MEGGDYSENETYPETLMPRLVDASFADRVGENDAICSSSHRSPARDPLLHERLVEAKDDHGEVLTQIYQ